MKSFFTDTWNSSKHIGPFNPGAQGATGSMLRGGDYAGFSTAGIFAAALYGLSSGASATLGFRCTSTSPLP